MECAACGEQLFSRLERQRGTCARCYLAAWSPEKVAAIGSLPIPLGRRVEMEPTHIESNRDVKRQGAAPGPS